MTTAKTAKDLAELVAYAPINPLLHQGVDPFSYLARRLAEADRLIDTEGDDSVLGDYSKVSIFEHVDRVHPTYRMSKFHRRLLSVGERFARGELTRVIANCPTRYGKSEATSKILPSYCLRLHPERHAIIGSCDEPLSTGFADRVREFFRRSGGKISATQDAKKHFRTVEGGGCYAVGRGGRAVGEGANWLFIDDPCKSDVEAMDPRVQQTIIDWWKGVLFQRLHKNAGIWITTNRWPGGDFIHYLMEQEAQAPQGWHFLMFDAVRGMDYDPKSGKWIEAPPFEVPDTCTLEPDWREEGELLWPEEYDRDDVLNRILVGGKWAEAVIQQRPADEAIQNRVVPNFGDHNLAPLDWILPGSAFLGCDFNVEPLVGVIGQFVGNDRVHFLGEIEIEDNGLTDDLALRARQAMPAGVHRHFAYPDPSGDHRDTRSRTNDHQILRDHGFEVMARDNNPHVSVRINAFNMACGSPGRPQKIWVDPVKCPNLVEALRKHRRDPKTGKPRKGKGDGYAYDHWFDAASYAIELWSPFDMGSGVGFEKMPI